MLSRLIRPFFLFLGLAVLALPAAPARAEKLALVIGMAGYEHIVTLDNTINDARGVGRVLQDAGFTVTLSLNAPKAGLTETLADFSFQAETADLALIYFAGHGVEVQGQNFLIPVDADVKSNLEVQAASLSLADFEAAVGHARKMGVVLLDSCRDNPFADNIALDEKASDGRTRQYPQRLGLCRAGADRSRSRHSGFLCRRTRACGPGRRGWPQPLCPCPDRQSGPATGLEVGTMVRQVRDEVMRATGNLQQPYSYGSLPGTPFYVAGPRNGEADVGAAEDRQQGWAALGADQDVLLQAQAEKGDTRSILGLGYIKLNKADPAFDPVAARDWFERAAKAGSPEAQFELARLLEQGIGGPPDPQRALDLYRMSAGMKTEEEIQSALTAFATNYPEIAKDEILADAGRTILRNELIKDLKSVGADEAEIDEIKHDGRALAAAQRQLRSNGHKVRSYHELLDEVGKTMATKFGVKRASDNSDPSPPPKVTPQPGSTTQARVERKRTAPQQPRAAGVRGQTPSAPNRKSPADVVAQMRKDRGFPSL